MALIPNLNGTVKSVRPIEDNYNGQEVTLTDCSQTYPKRTLESDQKVLLPKGAPPFDLPVGSKVSFIAFPQGDGVWEGEGHTHLKE